MHRWYQGDTAPSAGERGLLTDEAPAEETAIRLQRPSFSAASGTTVVRILIRVLRGDGLDREIRSVGEPHVGCGEYGASVGGNNDVERICDGQIVSHRPGLR